VLHFNYSLFQLTGNTDEYLTGNTDEYQFLVAILAYINVTSIIFIH